MRFPVCAALFTAALLPLAAAAADAGLTLKPSARPGLNASGSLSQQPAYISADRIEGTSDKKVMAAGKAELRKGELFIGADALEYSTAGQEVRARGNVRIEREGLSASGPGLRYRLEEATGEFEKPDYTFSRIHPITGQTQSGRGTAEKLEFSGEDRYLLTDVTFTTCKPGSTAWFVKAGTLDVDVTRNLGEAQSAGLYFHDTPVLYVPWMSFSLNGERKSGVLPPFIGSTSQGGSEISIPYYFNIAPNMDLTLYGRHMEKRGEQVNGDFRYLQPTYGGQMKFELLPDDKVLHRQRTALSVNHSYVEGRLMGLLNVNKVSDDSYFRDLASRINLTAQTNLLREGLVNYSGNWWESGTYGATVRIQKFQTLQDPNSPVTKPYERTPQITVNALRQDLKGMDLAVNAEYVDFTHPTQVIGRRTTLYPSLSLPVLSAGAFLTPKIGVHNTYYSLDRNTGTIPDTVGRSIPIMSVDSGLVFERETSIGSNSFIQTLEPRAYYVRVPYQNQDRIPLFDTAVADFNYAQIFSENSFVGGDRINDANQLTTAMTSRLLSPNTGQEVLRGTIGQRYYLTNQEVTLNPGDTRRTYKTSDWLAALSGRLSRQWTAETAVQYNPRERRAERLNLSARYQPEQYKLLNLSYRYLRDQLGQIDVSAQWPLGGGFYGVGRYNFSLRDGRVIESLGGVEYNGDCWVLRGVMQRFATAAGQTTNTFFLQLELTGFSRLGSNPLEALKRNIPGYSRLNQAPSANQTVDLFD